MATAKQKIAAIVRSDRGGKDYIHRDLNTMNLTILGVYRDDYTGTATNILLAVLGKGGLVRVQSDGSNYWVKVLGVRHYLTASQLGLQEVLAA